MNSAAHHFVAGEILKVAAAGRMIASLGAKATPRLTSPMSRMLANPNFQQVLESSMSGFPKLPGLNLLSPSTQRGILRPSALGAIPGGTMKQMQQHLVAARPAMARTIRGFRDLQRQGVM